MNMSPSTDRPRLGIVGGGRAAWAFGSAWQECGWPIAGVSLRDGSRSELPRLLRTDTLPIDRLWSASDVILIAVPDSAIAEVSAGMPSGPGSPGVFHASGALTSDVLAPHENRFSLHPLLALPVVGDPDPLRNALLVYEGSEKARTLPEYLAAQCGGRLLEISRESKILYHAAAVFSSNYVATLLATSRALMKRAGLPADLEPWLGNLARSAIANWERQRGRSRFTGPVARGDLAIIRQHLDAMSDQPDLAALYSALAKETAEHIRDDE